MAEQQIHMPVQKQHPVDSTYCKNIWTLLVIKREILLKEESGHVELRRVVKYSYSESQNGKPGIYSW